MILFFISFLSAQQGKTLNTYDSNSINSKSVPVLLSQIKSVLSDMLVQLKIIANKDTNVEVNVPPAQISVYPNITIPEEDCEWETFAQIIELNLQGDGASTYISIPENHMADEIEIEKGYALFNWQSSGNDKSVLKVNGEVCLNEGGRSGNTYSRRSLISDCFDSFEPGLNLIFIDNENTVQEPIGVKTIWLEMKVKPANC